MKTVKCQKPFTKDKIRLVSGRMSPDYSYGISDPRTDIQKTGDAVLSIWNARVNQSLEDFNTLRLAVLIRNFLNQEFCFFEQPIELYPVDDYEWCLNNRDNLEGVDRRSRVHWFTWQPHGSQFTVIRGVPGSARRFRINKTIESYSMEAILQGIGYQQDWITIETPQ